MEGRRLRAWASRDVIRRRQPSLTSWCILFAASRRQQATRRRSPFTWPLDFPRAWWMWWCLGICHIRINTCVVTHATWIHWDIMQTFFSNKSGNTAVEHRIPHVACRGSLDKTIISILILYSKKAGASSWESSANGSNKLGSTQRFDSSTPEKPLSRWRVSKFSSLAMWQLPPALSACGLFISIPDPQCTWPVHSQRTCTCASTYPHLAPSS